MQPGSSFKYLKNLKTLGNFRDLQYIISAKQRDAGTIIMQKRNRIFGGLVSSLSWLLAATAQAGSPLWTFEPLTPTTVAVPANGISLVQYRVTNQSSKPHTLTMQSIVGITQINEGLGACNNPFMLAGHHSCILSLHVDGSKLNSPINEGPVVCQQNSNILCYRPSAANILHITQSPAVTDVIITVTGSPLILTATGPSGELVIKNTSTQVPATNVSSNFTGTALDGNVTETGNTCANIPPQGSCTLTFTPGNTSVAQTDFSIRGTNTDPATAAIMIQQVSSLSAVTPNTGVAAGGNGVVLTGAGLTGATAVTFGGIAATSVNVINSTTVTAVTPAHAVGVVDVIINTPAGGATLVNGYTYIPTVVGQISSGGTIACLGGGLQNLIAAVADNNAGIEWGGNGITTNGQSDGNGAANTTTIIGVLGNNGGNPYAAQVCGDYEIDSQGNTPCQAGNTCYNDWFLPAKDQLNCLFNNQATIGGFSPSFYWTSTEFSPNPGNFAWYQDFDLGSQIGILKSFINRVRCVRVFVP